MNPIIVESTSRPNAPIFPDQNALTVREFLSGHRSLYGQALMDLLTVDPDLKNLFLMDAGGGEKYSIGKHTRMVIDSFEQELMDRPETQEILSSAGITSAQFMFFLALHDIGKGRAVQEHPPADEVRKGLELQYSREVVSSYCKKMDLESCESLFLALLLDDAVGDICKSTDPTASEIMKAAEEIRKSAEQCGRFIEEFLPLKQLFHMTDAASYPHVRKNFFITDKEQRTSLNGNQLPRLIGHTGQNQHKLARLSHCLRYSELPPVPPRAPFPRDPETLQAIFSRSAFEFSWEEILDLGAWQREIKHEKGNKSPLYCYFKKSLRAIKMDRLPFRSYLQWKKRPFVILHRHMREDGMMKLAALASPPYMQQNLDQLSQIRFLHGSNSSALIMMLLSGNPCLQNTDSLLNSGIAPMCGELNRGITPNGINIGSISVETIRDIPHVLQFALGTETIKPFDPVKFQLYLDPFKIIQLKKETVENIESYYEILRKNKVPVDGDSFKTFGMSPEPTTVGLKIRRKKILQKMDRIAFLGSLHDALTRSSIPRASTANELNLDPSEMPDSIEGVINPYIGSTAELEWNKHAIQLLQFKQWDPSGYEAWSTAFADLFLKAVDSEWAEQRKPFEQLLAIMDAEFSDGDKAVIRDHLSGKTLENTPLPVGLTGIFNSLSEIPAPSETMDNLDGAMSDISIVYRIKSGFMEGKYSWAFMISALLMEKTKMGGHVENRWKVKIREQLTKMKENRERLARILNSPRSVVQIPQDEKIRSLFTHPLPLIFASTCVVPERGPGEYVINRPVPLGKGGVDLIFTDSKESKHTIKALLPENLRREIKIGLFEKLDGGGLPLEDKSN